MDDLIAFIKARLDEDEAAARAVPTIEGTVPPAHWTVSSHADDGQRVVMGTAADFEVPTPEHAAHIARHDPASILREIASKREILDRIVEYRREHPDGSLFNAPEVLNGLLLRAMAVPYVEHPEYRREWEPRTRHWP